MSATCAKNTRRPREIDEDRGDRYRCGSGSQSRARSHHRILSCSHCCSSSKRRSHFRSKRLEDRFSALADDIAMEILVRLPPKALGVLSCTSKRWMLMSRNPALLHIYDKRFSNMVFGLFGQMTHQCCDREFKLNYIPLDIEPLPHRHIEDSVLDFLPEKVIVIASCNGFLCCRSLVIGRCSKRVHHNAIPGINQDADHSRMKVTIYICNPAMRHWIAVRPEGYNLHGLFGFEYCRYGSSFPPSSPSFKLVSIQQSEQDADYGSFVVYSSQTQAWKRSREIHIFASKLRADKHIFVNKRFHWLTWNHNMLAFDPMEESAQVIRLPGVMIREYTLPTGCLGSSQGYVHYICAYEHELKVWYLKDYHDPSPSSWLLKFSLPLLEFCLDNNLRSLSDLKVYWKHPTPGDVANPTFRPLAYMEETLFLDCFCLIVSYNFETKKLVRCCGFRDIGPIYVNEFTWLPYCPTLTSLGNFKDFSAKRLQFV